MDTIDHTGEPACREIDQPEGAEMASIDEMIRSYVASWNENDPAKRSLTIEETLVTPSPRTVSSSHSRKWIPITTRFATGGRWFPPAAANPTRSRPTSPSSVPTGVSSVTISSSISLRRRTEPETGQPGAASANPDRPYTRPNRPRSRAATSRLLGRQGGACSTRVRSLAADRARSRVRGEDVGRRLRR